MLSSDTLGMIGMSSGQQDVTSTMLYIILDESKADNGKLIDKKLEKLALYLECEYRTASVREVLLI